MLFVKRLFALWIGFVVSWWTAFAGAQTPNVAPSPWLAPRRPDGTTYAPTTPTNSSDAGAISASSDAASPPSNTAASDAAAPSTAPQPAPTGTPTPQPANVSPANSAGATATTTGATSASTTAAANAPSAGTSAAGSSTTGTTSTPSATVRTAPLLPEPRRVSLTRARIRLLDASFAGLSGRSSSQRILDGIVSIGAGAVMAGSSFVIPSTPGLTDLRPWLWATSGYLALQGIVNLAWAPARERLSRQYEALPMGTAAQRRERLRFGEGALEEIAADGHRRRILAGIANIAATGGLLTIAYMDPIFNGVPRPLSLTDAVILTYGGVSVVLHIVQMLTLSEEERLRNAYFQQLELLRAERARAEANASN